MRNWAGRGALITGGGSGIGLAMAEAFASRSMRVVIGDVNADALETAGVELRTGGAEVLPLLLDVADVAAWPAATEVVKAFGPLHLICANAGIAPSGKPLSELAPEAWDRMLAVNLSGVFHTVRALLPLIEAHGQGGHVVLTASMAGMVAGPPIGDYAVTKFGVGAMGEVLRAELAPKGIGVSVLYPGVVATPLVGESRASGMSPKSVAARVIRAIEADEMFVFTHADYRPLVEARMEAIVAAFSDSADPGFRESPAVLQMMRNTAVNGAS
jgi:NAD(P)-dependent dehydrogenase (short-subunit alcohol dehydrogenase family)